MAMRIGLVGYGTGGRHFHAPFIQAAAGTELAGIVARAPATVERARADHPSVPIHASLTEMLSAGVDAVTITTPPETRRELVLEAIDAGVPVITDKPFAPNAEAGRELDRAAKAAGVPLGVFHNRRLDADFLTLRKVVAEGRLGRPGYGILCDNRIGRQALHASAGTDLWVGRPCEWPGSRPLTLEPELGLDCGGLEEWARDNVVKVLCFCHPTDAPETRAGQEETVKRLFEASRRNGLEFLLEIIPSKVAPVFERPSEEHGYAGGYTVVKDHVRIAPAHLRRQHRVELCRRQQQRGIGLTGGMFATGRRGHAPTCCPSRVRKPIT